MMDDSDEPWRNKVFHKLFHKLSPAAPPTGIPFHPYLSHPPRHHHNHHHHHRHHTLALSPPRRMILLIVDDGDLELPGKPNGAEVSLGEASEV